MDINSGMDMGREMGFKRVLSYVEIHYSHSHNNRLFLFSSSDKADNFDNNRKDDGRVCHVTQLTHTNVHAKRDNICHFIYVPTSRAHLTF